MQHTTIVITHSVLDDLVGVYRDDRFHFSTDDIDDGNYLGGGDPLDAFVVALDELARLFIGLTGLDGDGLVEGCKGRLDALRVLDVSIDPSH